MIGGGLMGVATAYWLSRIGVDVELIEAGVLGSGSTGRNAGLMLHGLSALEAPRLLADVSAHEHLDCGYSRVGHLSLMNSPAYWERVQSEVRKRPSTAPPLYALDHSACEDLLGMRINPAYIGGRWYPDGCVIHSSRYLHELARAATAYGARIYSRTRVLAVESTASGVQVHTTRGSLRAARVVHATSARAVDLLPELAQVLTPIRVQVMTTTPVAPAFAIALGVNWGDVYGRQLPDGRFVIGGCGGTNIAAALASEHVVDHEIQARLDGFLSDCFPTLPRYRAEQRWAGVLDCTPDGKPLVGAHPGRSGHWLATGFNGHGLPVALGLGQALANDIASGTMHDALNAWRPDRFEQLARPM